MMEIGLQIWARNKLHSVNADGIKGNYYGDRAIKKVTSWNRHPFLKEKSPPPLTVSQSSFGQTTDPSCLEGEN